MDIYDKTPLLQKIVDAICGEMPHDSEFLDKDNMRRSLCWALSEHYIGMSLNDYMTLSWIQDQSGWTNVFNTALQAQGIVQRAGCDALDFLDMKKLSEQIKQECNKAGFVAKSG